VQTTPLSIVLAASLYAGTLGILSTLALAGEPMARDLIALAPVISGQDDKSRTIEIAGHHQVDDNVVRIFRALYRAPDRFFFVNRYGHDGNPIVMPSVDRLLD
jgi:hypothetical protein